MQPHNRTAATTGIVEAAVVKTVVETSSYQNRPTQATAESYATAKLLTRFRLRIETARLVCHLSGIGGQP
jgi:hypothetical protein